MSDPIQDALNALPLDSYEEYLAADRRGPTEIPREVLGAAPSSPAGARTARRPRLGEEASPYLLRQARGPIGWYPWGPEAFEAARREEKPIFLSIGFSACHWCHVMERECFNDAEAAGLMNDACIPVLVDREERPDIDGLFMDVCRVQNGSGGWPLNVLLTPEGLPFFATTWLPKRAAGEMPGLTDILPRVKWLWLMQREDVDLAAAELTRQTKEKLPGGMGRVRPAAAREAMAALEESFDKIWGGFGKAPKFPDAPKLLFLLQQANSALNSRQERIHAFRMADVTLRRMWRGGIHDHLGGGFARCSSDERWLLPSFEKLLPDQALLLLAASLAHEYRPDAFYRLMAEDIVNCVKRDFADPSQGFRSAVDAEEGEGLYYLWTLEEVRSLLPEGDAGLFCAAYAVMPGGNFGSEFAGSKIGYNILYETSTVTELGRRFGLRGPDVAQRLANGRRILLEARSRRPAPGCDDKVLMDWNGLMIGALARASAEFERPEWRAAAERAALALQKALRPREGGWNRRLRGDRAGIPALAGDYAALLWGVMELHRAAGKAGDGDRQLSEWLRYAQDLAAALVEGFWDETAGGFFLTRDPALFLRYKSAEDGSIPAANALAALALDALGLALGEAKYAEMARRVIASFARSVNAQPLAHLSMISAALLWMPVKPKEEPKPAPADSAPESVEAVEVTETAEAEPQDDAAARRAARAARRERPAPRSERRGARPRRGGRS